MSQIEIAVLVLAIGVVVALVAISKKRSKGVQQTPPKPRPIVDDPKNDQK